MSNSKYISVKRAFALITALVMTVLCLSSCGGAKGSKSVKIKSLNESSTSYSLRDYHISDRNNLVYVAKSGLIELYFDSVTYGVAVKETSTDKIWYSLPLASDGDESCAAAVMDVRVSKDENIYNINSQDNSVAFSSATFKPTSNGIQVTYNMALDAETAAKGSEAVNDGSLYISVTAVYSLSDGVFNATINCGDMIVSDGYTVESIDFMNYFGATSKAEQDDFIFVPDACGALVKAGNTAEDMYETRTYKVYGNDRSMDNAENETASEGTEIKYADAIIPAFGMKCSEDAFLGIIVSGDTAADIISHRYNGGGTYNRVGASFRVTDVMLGGKEGKYTKYTGEAYSGELKICYRFLSGKNAGYVGLASACRETLIRNSVLSSDVVSTSQHIPFMLTVQGAAAKKNPKSYEKLSTYEQTLDLLNLLKAKSVNDIDIRYSGMLTGANNQGLLSKVKPIGSLGSKRDYDELRQYVSTQKFEIYIDIDMLGFNKKSASPSKYGATDLEGESIYYLGENSFSDNSENETYKRYAVSMSVLENQALDFLNNIKDYASDGYCINDAGKILYSDYSDEAHSRSNAVNILSNQAAMLANNHKIMVDNGNFYMLKNADVVVDLPRNTDYPENEGYVSVPFVQIILHGLADYSMEPINLCDDTKAAFLKSVETGAMPSYEWYCTKTENAVDGKYHYENQLSSAAENYITADKIIGDLRNARITSHYEVQQGVYCTEYNNSIIIYTNYNDAAVTVNSISVEPMSCLRVN